jgi:hypothetical protein
MAYVDGELTESRRGEVRAHVEECSECRAFVGELQQVSARLSSWQVGDLPNGLTTVKEALAAAMPDRRRAGSWWVKRGPLRLAWWSFAAGLAVVAIVLVLTPRLRRVPSPNADQRSVALREVGESNGAAATPAASTAPPARPALGDFQGVRGQGQGQQGGNKSLQPLSLNRAGAQQSDRMIVRSATISLTSDHFDQIRQAIERLTTQHQGRVAALNLTGDASTRRSLRATLRVPAAQLDALLAGLRALGRVQDESLGTDDVTESFRDLGLRTANARREEQRLVELLAKHTGDLADVLAVERELARVRLDIERMDAETRATQQRVDLATIELTVSEQYRADLVISALPLSVQLKNALVDGSRNAAESLVAAVLFVLQVAPSLILWSLPLVWPARWGWRRLQAARSS